MGHSRRVIKNAVLHITGDMPMLADLLARPQTTDVSLLCTNLRTLDGKRPRSVEHADGIYVIPLATIRFVELPSLEMEESASNGRRNGHSSVKLERGSPPRDAPVFEADGDLELEPDEDLLRRIREV